MPASSALFQVYNSQGCEGQQWCLSNHCSWMIGRAECHQSIDEMRVCTLGQYHQVARCKWWRRWAPALNLVEPHRPEASIQSWSQPQTHTGILMIYMRLSNQGPVCRVWPWSWAWWSTVLNVADRSKRTRNTEFHLSRELRIRNKLTVGTPFSWPPYGLNGIVRRIVLNGLRVGTSLKQKIPNQ